MSLTEKTKITISTTVRSSLDQVWECWTNPKHITQWNNASPEWHTPRATTDLKVGGKFVYRMEAKDGSFGFDFIGVFNVINPKKTIAYTLDDKRKVEISFNEKQEHIQVTETFEAETENSVELQKTGWQAILDNFKKYVENNGI